MREPPNNFDSAAPILEYSRREGLSKSGVTRFLVLFAISFASVALPIVWTMVGLRWMSRNNIPSGAYADSVYEPIFIDRPLLIGPVTLGLMATLTVERITRGRWSQDWCGMIVLYFFEGLLLFAMMAGYSESAFP